VKLESPSLEAWFNRYQGGAKHQLGGTMVAPLPGPRLASLLPPDWSPADFETGYTSTPGSQTLRHALAAADDLDPDALIMTSGATEANASVLFALLEPGCNVVLQDPLYYQFAGLAEGLGVDVRRWTLPADPFAAPDLDRLWSLLDARTRLVVLNTPHNPTGRVLSMETLAAIARRVEALPEAYLLVDEIYRGVTPGDGPSIAALSPRGIAVNALSKRWSLPGFRLGWVACADQRVAQRILAWHEHLTCSVSRMSEQMLEWLWPQREVLWAENAAIAQANRMQVADWIPSVTAWADVQLPPAGVMTLVWPHGTRDDMALGRQLRELHDCFVVPGSCLGYPGALRIGFGHRDPVALSQALGTLRHALAAFASVPA
jgi:aspartate/methionine/tyrosine aminotransferase